MLLRLSHIVNGGLKNTDKYKYWEAVRVEGKGGSRVGLSTNLCRYQEKRPLVGMRTTQPSGTRLYRAAPTTCFGIGSIKDLLAAADGDQKNKQEREGL